MGRFIDWLMKPHEYRKTEPETTEQETPPEYDFVAEMVRHRQQEMEMRDFMRRQRMEANENRRKYEEESEQRWRDAIREAEEFERNWWSEHGTPPPGRSAASLRQQRDDMAESRRRSDEYWRDRRRDFDRRMDDRFNRCRCRGRCYCR